MKQIVPDYYHRFTCMGGKCPHNCCIGWEIDIDDTTLARYGAVTGPLGQKLRRNIALDGCAHFLLDSRERCPFLNGDNLCQLIIELSRDSLCQICSDHPRFYNQWPDRTEAGLGLCCPAAAELILRQKAPVALMAEETDGENSNTDPESAALLSYRDRLFACLQNRTLPMEMRLARILALSGSTLPARTLQQWADIYRPLERMDAAWDLQLDRLARGDTVSHLPSEEDFETALEQLAVYFLYRHLFGALEDGRITERVLFVAHTVQLLSSLSGNIAELIELSRLYSAEIEYSEENLDAILNALT